jgi:hypothetical protein
LLGAGQEREISFLPSAIDGNGRKPERWYRAPPASGFASAPVLANLAYRVVNDSLQLVWVGIGVARLDVLHGAMKQAPTDCLFDEFGKIALFPP